MYVVEVYVEVRGDLLRKQELLSVKIADLELANMLVDEILEYRKGGEKSSYMRHLEEFHCVNFKQTSGSVIRLKEVITRILRTER